MGATVIKKTLPLLFLCVLLAGGSAFAQTATPTDTSTPTTTPTNTNTPTSTSTPTPTFFAANTPKATAYAVSPLLSPYTLKRRSATLAVTGDRKILAPRIANKRNAVWGITVVSDTAGSVKVRSISNNLVETFTFVAENLNVPQYRPYPAGLIFPVDTDVYAEQTGTAASTITVDYSETRP